MRRLIVLFVALSLVLLFPLVAVGDEEEEWDGFTFDLQDLNGDELDEQDVFSDGRLYLVDFWASWCRPCNQYLPKLEEMVDDYGEQGFKVVIFVVDQSGSVSNARATLEAEEYPFTFLFDAEAAIQDELGVQRIPTTVLFDPEGEELWRHVGYASGDEDEVREQIEENLPDEDDCDDADDD